MLGRLTLFTSLLSSWHGVTTVRQTTMPIKGLRVLLIGPCAPKRRAYPVICRRHLLGRSCHEVCFVLPLPYALPTAVGRSY